MSKTLTKFEIVNKFGKLFAGTLASHPALQGIRYAEDRTVFVTNGHYALRIKDVYSVPQPMTLHAKTGQPIEDRYPDFSRLFPTDFHEELEIPQAAVSEVLLAAQCAAAVAVKLNKKVPTVRMEIDDGDICLSVDSLSPQLSLSVKIGDAPAKSKSLRTFNVEYFSTALAIFEAAHTDVTLKLRGANEPIVLSSGTGIDVMIMPYRVSE